MNEGENCGIIYIATGKEYIEEARISAESAKSVMHDVPITLFADVEANAAVFDDVVDIDNPRYDFGDQVFHINRTPYKRTIFLDTDIYIDESIKELFDVLDKFDIAAAQDQINYSSERVDYEAIDEIPDCFPEYNSGVVAFKSNPAVSDFIKTWQNAYTDLVNQGQIHNQAAFRLALYWADVRIATLPSEYNCVFRRSGCVNGHVKAFHGRLLDIDSVGAGMNVDIEQAVNEINSRSHLRIYYQSGGMVRLLNPSLVTRVGHSVQERGILGTVKRVPQFLKRRRSDRI